MSKKLLEQIEKILNGNVKEAKKVVKGTKSKKKLVKEDEDELDFSTDTGDVDAGDDFGDDTGVEGDEPETVEVPAESLAGFVAGIQDQLPEEVAEEIRGFVQSKVEELEQSDEDNDNDLPLDDNDEDTDDLQEEECDIEVEDEK